MTYTPQKLNQHSPAIAHRSIMPSMQELHELTILCKSLSETPFYRSLGAGGVLAIWLTARELNLPPMMCLNGGLHNVEGKVQLSAQLINMMIVNAGHEIKILFLHETGCRIQFIRNLKNGAQKIDECEFNEKDAHRAKVFGVRNAAGSWDRKPKDNWLMYPKAMYFARAMSIGGKMYFPDVVFNVYSSDEIEETDVEAVKADQAYAETVTPIGRAIEPTIAQTGALMELEHSIESKVEKFKEKFKIGSDSHYEKYLTAISEKCRKEKEEMIACAALNETGFVEAFEKWKANIEKKEQNESAT